VGLHETRIETVRLGSNGDVTAGEIIASYDFDHFLQGRPQRLVLRDLRVSARLDAGGLSFESLTSENGEGRRLDGALLRSIPALEIESGQIDLTTPIGPVAMSLTGAATPRSDGSVEAAIDLQARTADGRLGGVLAGLATTDPIGAGPTVAEGTAALGRGLSGAFAGKTKMAWAATGHPQVSAALDLKAIDAGGTVFPAGSLTVEMADAQWTMRLAVAQDDSKSDLTSQIVI